MNTNFEKRRNGKRFLFFPLVALAFVALGGWVVMVLWNYVIPVVIPNVGALTYWQAISLLLLCRLLFGGFKGGGPGMRGGRGQQWRQKMSNMSEEDRAKFKAAWRDKCGRRM